MQSLNDIIENFHLYAICERCQRQRQLDIAKLIERLGKDTKLHTMRSKLRCRLCHTHSEDIRIVYVGGTGDRKAIFQYRR